MKLKRGLSVLLVLLCGVVFLIGCSTKQKETGIKEFTPYYMTSLTPYAFTFLGTSSTGDPEVETYKMHNDDYSFMEFGKDLKTMWIIFTTGKNGRIEFVVTSFTKKSGQIEGKVSRIEPVGPEKGKIRHYSFWSDKDGIYFKSDLTYNVYTATKSPESDSERHRIVTVTRNQPVVGFARVTPGWIGGGA